MATATTDAEVLAAVQAQAEARDELLAHSADLAREAVASFDEWYDHRAIGAWARAVHKAQQSVQRQIAAMTDAYLAHTGSLVAGQSLRPVGVVNVANLRGVDDPVQVYGRPADVYRFDLWRGAPEESARERATLRLVTIGESDAIVAARDQSAKFMQERNASGYRRVVHPELSRAKTTCGLCIVASDRVYKSTDLMPLHAHCHCVPVPIYGGNDAAARINAVDLGRLYSDAGSTAAGKLKGTRYTVDEHGELGPVLNRRGQPFRNAKQAAKTDRYAMTPEKNRAALASLEKQLPQLRERAARTPKAAGTLAAVEQRITDLRARVAS